MSEHASQHGHGEHHPETLHEENSVQFAPVLIFAVVMVIVSIATFLTVKIIERAFDTSWSRSEAPVSPLAQAQMPPAPLLEVSPGQARIDLRAKEQEVINSYRWIDEKGGVVGIPVEEAIKLLAQRGLPVRDQAKAE
jgi:hypothetical protein